MQFSLNFRGRLPVSAKIGMAKADQNAKARWKAIIGECVESVARRLPELTVDDVLAEYEKLPEDIRPTTHALDALGPAMVRAARDGILESTGRIARSMRDEKHGNRHTIWKSLYYRP